MCACDLLTGRYWHHFDCIKTKHPETLPEGLLEMGLSGGEAAELIGKWFCIGEKWSVPSLPYRCSAGRFQRLTQVYSRGFLQFDWQGHPQVQAKTHVESGDESPEGDVRRQRFGLGLEPAFACPHLVRPPYQFALARTA